MVGWRMFGLDFIQFQSRKAMRYIQGTILENSEVENMYSLSTGRTKIMGKPLMWLLLKFYNRECSVPRDRIFSLVSLCSEKDRIKVEYGCSVFQLAHQIVDACRSTICMCTTVLILDMLDPEIQQLSSDELTHLMADGPYLEFDLYPIMNRFYPNGNVHQGCCALLGKLINDLPVSYLDEPDREHKNIYQGFSWSKHINDRWAQKFRVSFVYARAWFKQQDKSRRKKIGRSFGILPKSKHGSIRSSDTYPRLGWGNSDMHAN
ncbi:hypothetical protein IG631_18799 [Alternaria alternata]|nr:hypothetical protein IG631_18799 [Alternaria alternata]